MKKSTIIISCTVIVVCFILMLSLCCISSQKNSLMLSLCCISSQKNSAYAINRTIIKENLVCYQGSAYYHHINVFLRTDSKVSSYSSKYYTTGSELLLEFNRGKHNSGIGLSAHNHDIAGWVIFQLVNSSNVVVSSKKFYQAYKNDNPVDGDVVSDSGTFSLSFSDQTGSFSLRVITNYFRDDKDVSDDAWKDNQYNGTTYNDFQQKSNQTILTITRDISSPTISFKKGSSSGTTLSANADGKYYTNNTTLYISASDANLSSVKVSGSTQSNNSIPTAPGMSQQLTLLCVIHPHRQLRLKKLTLPELLFLPMRTVNIIQTTQRYIFPLPMQI